MTTLRAVKDAGRRSYHCWQPALALAGSVAAALRHWGWYWSRFRPGSGAALSGKVAVVTGANRGLGLGLVRELLLRGASVTALVRPKSPAADLEALASTHPGLTLERAELQEEAELRACARRLLDRLERIDLLVNNAGVFGQRAAAVEDIGLSDLRRTLDVNALAPLALTRELIPLLRKGDGKVFQMTSELGCVSSVRSGGHVSYSVSKAALNMVNRMLANMLPELTFVAVYPGWVRTDMGGPSAPLDAGESCRRVVDVLAAADGRLSGEVVDLYGRRLSP